jgi:uncharacterized protein YdhG (YjbR/CyaY superfamily)
MKRNPASYSTIDEYIENFPEEIQKKLGEIRAAIRYAAPEAKEKISYQMPTFELYGNLVHFAAFTHHISFFPTPSGVQAFQEELSQYETSRGTIKIPLDTPLPLDLISRITKFRVIENTQKAQAKSAKKKAK